MPELYSHLLLQLLEITGAVCRQRVAAIHEGMNKDSIDSLLLRHFQQGIKMGLLRMDAAIGEQTEQMQPAFTQARVFHRRKQHGM